MDGVQYTTLIDVFKQVPDPRKRKGRVHGWTTILGLIAAALASACRTPTAIARWVREHHDEVLSALPPTVVRLPSDATLRRALAQLDVKALEQALSAFQPPEAARLALPNCAPARPEVVPPVHHVAPAAAASPPRQGVAIDGKAIRGVGRDGHPCHLVSLVTHAQATVLAQVAVAQKRDERSAVPVLLAGRDLRGQVATLDALHTLRPTAQLILERDGHYLMIVKKNQAVLYEFLDLLFTLPAHPADHEEWDQVGPTTTKGHGRLETRTLISGAAHVEDVDWPGVEQLVRRECERIVREAAAR
jgi:DDE family transposase